MIFIIKINKMKMETLWFIYTLNM